MTTKIKVRFRIVREKDGKLTITTLDDETIISTPEGESFESLRGFVFSTEITEKELIIEKSWDEPKYKI